MLYLIKVIGVVWLVGRAVAAMIYCFTPHTEQTSYSSKQKKKK